MQRLAKSMLAALALVVALTAAAAAQQVLVETTTLSAMREAAGVYMQMVDMDTGAAAYTVKLDGPASIAPMISDEQTALVSTGPAWHGAEFDARSMWTQLAKLRTSPLTLDAHIRFRPGWRQFAACTLADGSIVTLGTAPDDAGGWSSCVEIYSNTAKSAPTRWDIPGTALAAVPLDAERIAVLAREPLARSATVYAVNTDTPGTSIAHDIADDANQLSTTPGGLAISKDGRWLFVLTSGFAADQPSGDPVSWLHVLDTRDLTEPMPALEITGAADMDNQSVMAAGAGCWVATRARASGFAYVTHVEIADNLLRAAAKHSLTDVTRSFVIAPSPLDENTVIAAADNRLERYTQAERTPVVQRYKAPISVVRWTSDVLYIGEAGRVHLVDSQTLRPIKTVQLQSGWVTDIASMKVPTPAAPTNSFVGELPDSITLHGEAVGQEIKALPIELPDDIPWTLNYDREATPWLVLHPASGTGPSVVYMGVDPSGYVPGQAMTAELLFTLGDLSTRSVQVRVLPEKRSEIRRILWALGFETGEELRTPNDFRDASDPYGFGALAQMLAAPPLMFAHRQSAASYIDGLEPYSVIVLTAEAASQGALTRQELLEYVRAGGALLFLGQHMSEASRELQNWLAPFGVQIDLETQVDGAFSAPEADTLLTHWGKGAIRGGCSITMTAADGFSVPDPSAEGRVVFYATHYGLGRVALLASPTPLQTPALTDTQSRLFAADLFRWLAEAGRGTDTQDLDGDGLSDDIEDVNENAIVDARETNFLKADTDGDGIPDGMEDTNANGHVDAGETDPLNTDTDGDGIFDGADDMPLPTAGTPFITAVLPDEGPAEGGSRIAISGRDFQQSAVVWFGQRLSPEVDVVSASEIIAAVPPAEAPEGGRVAVRVVNADSQLETTLPEAYEYTPRTRVRLVLQSLPAIASQHGMYEGRFSLILEAPKNASVNHISVVLEKPDIKGFQWGKPSLQPSAERRRLITRTVRDDGVMITLLQGSATTPLNGPLAIVPWSYTPEAEPETAWRITTQRPRAITQNGQSLDISVRETQARINPPE